MNEKSDTSDDKSYGKSTPYIIPFDILHLRNNIVHDIFHLPNFVWGKIVLGNLVSKKKVTFV